MPDFPLDPGWRTESASARVVVEGSLFQPVTLFRGLPGEARRVLARILARAEQRSGFLRWASRSETEAVAHYTRLDSGQVVARHYWIADDV